MRPLAVEQAFQIARQHHQAGQLPQAETLYRQILQQDPNHADALHLLGVIACQTGRFDSAVDLIGRAVALQPNYPEAYSNLGVALKDHGQLDAAIAACRQAITLLPNYPEAYGNLANALQARGDDDAAIAACRQAIALKPNHPQAYNILGNALHSQRQFDAAIAAYRQAIALNPRFPEAHSNLGNALKSQGHLDAAAAACRQAIALQPNHAEAYNNLGNALQAKGQRDEAIAAYRQAIARKPNYAQAHNNLGSVLQAQGQLDAALAAFRQAIALKPNLPGAHGNLANALHSQGQIDEAIAAYRQAAALAPDNAAIHGNLVYTLHYHPACDARIIAAELGRWNLQHAAPLKKFIQPHTNDRNPERRLRIGYVSPNLTWHPAGRFLLPLLAHHDKKHFEVMAYSQVVVPDAMTEKLRACTDGWRSIVGRSDAQAADLIREDRIDILVDLAMHAADNRLLIFARKPAPVQVTYLACCSSTGLTTMDYRLSDPYLDPPGMDESVYSEKTMRLPEGYWCYQPSEVLPEVSTLPALERGHITFGCLNNFCKVNEPLLKLWARLMRAVPGAHLLLDAKEGRHRQRVHGLMEQEGVEPGRVRFAEQVSGLGYFRLYQGLDVALDTSPYGGGTTTCDALWMGVPVVSLVGKMAVGRGGLSILSNIGLPELAARSEDEYVRIATDLAHDLPRLGNLRSTLRQRMAQSPLMDAPRFARHIEAACRQMWRRWCATA